jgi:hypothetical protein
MKNIGIPVILILISAVNLTFGFVTAKFQGWGEVIRYSPYVIIVRCKSSPEPTRVINGIVNDNPLRSGRMGGVTMADVEIVSILKGTNVELGSSITLWSQYRPCQREAYLLFATEFQGTNCFALANYQVVPLGHSFDTNLLSNKDLDQQVKLMLQYRLNNLNQELKNGQEEKERLEQGIKP